MIGTIKHITNLQDSIYQKGTFSEFKSWYLKQTAYQLDIETDITEWWNTRKLISIQFGTVGWKDRQQWFLQWSALSVQERFELKILLEDDSKIKLAHNGAYEYIVLKFHGITIGNIYDTMLAEKVIMGGMDSADYTLADISWKYLNIIMDKTNQTLFGDDVITDSKILYGITDVAYLDIIKAAQMQKATQENLLNVIALENEVLPAFCDITYEGMILDKEKWRENLRWAEPQQQAAEAKLNEWMNKNEAWLKAVELKFVSSEDRVTINFNAPAQKTELLKLLFPTLPGGTKPIIERFMRLQGKDMSIEDRLMLMDYLEKRYDALQNRLIRDHRDYLVSKGYLIPAGVPTINWNSNQQALPIMQCFVPRLSGLAEEERDKHVHLVLKDYGKYKETCKLTGELGEDWIRKHVGPDGRVRTNFSQIKSTGRVGSRGPNMQNITVKEFVGTRYRNAFVAPEGMVFVSGDYISQELVLIATLSQEPAWVDTLRKGQDLHSVLAEVVYGTKWKEAADADCDYYKWAVNKEGVLEQQKLKCNCKKHKPLRYNVKTVNFMLAYGGTEFKLASELEISLREAKALIELYFSKLPRVKKLFKFLGDFTLKNGFTMTMAPFFRKRWFPYWKQNLPYLEAHMEEIKYNSTLGDIQKAGMNHPIQGSSADITKLALILIRNWIRSNGHENNIKLAMQIHDSIDTYCRIDLVPMWKLKLEELMNEAGKVVVTSGLLRSDVLESPCWTK